MTSQPQSPLSILHITLLISLKYVHRIPIWSKAMANARPNHHTQPRNIDAHRYQSHKYVVCPRFLALPHAHQVSTIADINTRPS